MNPQIFGWQHLTYLAIFLVISISLLILIKKYCKTNRAKSIAITVTAVVLLALIITNRASQALFVNEFKMSILLPTTWCSVTSYALALLCIFSTKRNNNAFHCIIYLALLGPTLTMIYPDFIGQSSSIFYLPTISGLLHHSVALFLAIMLIILKEFRPTIKKWYAFPLGACVLLTYALFLNNALGIVGALDIDGRPLVSGTPFTWYVVGALACILIWVSTSIYDYVKFRRNDKETKVLNIVKVGISDKVFTPYKNLWRNDNDIKSDKDDIR